MWSVTSLRERLIKFGAKVVSHGRCVTFQLTEVAVSRQTFQGCPDIHRQAVGAARPGMRGVGAKNGTEHEEEVHLAEGKGTGSGVMGATVRRFWLTAASLRVVTAAVAVQLGNAGNAG
jgi:hypothetical protein